MDNYKEAEEEVKQHKNKIEREGKINKNKIGNTTYKINTKNQ